MPPTPTGTITFLFTDIEGSSRKWEEQPVAMRTALATHDRILRQAFEAEGGYVFKTVGDAFCVAFDTAHDAFTAALEAQRQLHTTNWEGLRELNVRMALHTGAAEQRDGDYFGPSLNRVSRILAAAHGGQVLLSLPAEELVRDLLPTGVQLRPLGEHRLRDLARGEQLFQLVTCDLPTEFPALRSLESIPNNLPVQLTTFVGREREMTEVKRLLASTRLLTLTGMGGSGKTRLSLQVAADLLEQFKDGVWLVEFGAVDDPALVNETVAAALAIRQEVGRPLVQTMSDFLRSKQLLVILDNCEHVVAACAHLAETLLRTCPHLRILASSREPLGIAGETAWPLPPLSLPDHWRELAPGPSAMERLSSFEAVRLFIDRATIARPAFQLTDDNIHTVAQICWRLDGIPLAIELAAARIRVLTLQQIMERMDDRFHLLTTGTRTAAPRQQTLRALIDWSHDLLSEAERRLLRRLSVFVRGRTLDAIENACEGEGLARSEIIDLLSQLVDKSLIYVEKSPESGARYFMLESIWDYAREKLEQAGESSRYRERHLDYFLRFAEEAAPQIRGPAQREWLSRVEYEEINLRFAVETSEELPGLIPRGLRILTAVQRYVEVRGRFKETRELFTRLLAHPDAAPRNVIRARALAAAGQLAWVADHCSECARIQEEALAIFRELGDRSGAGFALVDLGFLAIDEKDFARARALLDEAWTIALELNDPRLTAHASHTGAALAAMEHDFTGALALDETALALSRENGDRWQVVIAAWSAGMNAAALGEFAMARGRLRECIEIGLDLGNRWGSSYPLEAFATLAVAEKRFERAAHLFGAAEAQRIRAGVVAKPADHPASLHILATHPEFGGTAVDAARMAGRTLTPEAAIEFALAEGT
jgi:predicted ATPase/class 3 adenylate cyclase